jgi:hypothetical protein
MPQYSVAPARLTTAFVHWASQAGSVTDARSHLVAQTNDWAKK